MPQWGKTDQANNSPTWAIHSTKKGRGKANAASNNTALFNNVTVGSFTNDQAIGSFAVSRAEMANTSGESSKVTHPGWHLRRSGMGGVKTVTVANGSGFGNGDSVLISGGTLNATAILTTNATGNLVSAVVSGALGKFANTSSLVFAFQREKHVHDLKVTGGTGYNNTDTIRVSNSIINATATIATDGNGLFVNAGITLTSIGVFANTEANTDVVITILAANGAASAGSGATVTANLSTSTGGAASATLGGRAGRVTYECLVAITSVSNGTADDTYLPQ